MNIPDIQHHVDIILSSGGTPAFAYDRVSTTRQEQEGQSLDYQARHSRKYAEDQGLTIVRSYSSAESAHKEGRKNFNRMLDDALACGVKDIIFKNTDRLSRNDVDWPRCKKLARNKGFRIHLYAFGVVFHSGSSAEEEMFLDNTASMAAYWSNKISQEVTRAYKDKRASGVRPGFCPVGYLYDKQQKKHVIDPDKRGVIDFVFAEFDNNNISVETLVSRLNDMGYTAPKGGKWYRSYLHALLSNPFYAGKFWHGEQLVEGTQEVYISWERFAVRESRLSERWQGNKTRDFDFPFANMLISPEGKVLTGEQKKGKYNYYSCTVADGRQYYKESDIIKWVDQAVQGVQYSQHFAEFLKDTFADLVDTTNRDHSKLTRSLNSQITVLKHKQSKIISLFTMDDMPVDVLREELNRVQAEVKALELQKVKAGDIKTDVIIEIAEVIDKLRKFPAAFASYTLEGKAGVLRAMVSRVVIGEGTARIEWKKPFSYIIQTVPYEEVLTGTLKHAGLDEFRTLCGDILLHWAA